MVRHIVVCFEVNPQTIVWFTKVFFHESGIMTNKKIKLLVLLSDWSLATTRGPQGKPIKWLAKPAT